MADRIVYVVTGIAGIYSDRREWPARVCFTEAEAQRWTTRLTADGQRARREYEALEESIEQEARWAPDEDAPGTWPDRLKRLTAEMLDGRNALRNALYYRSEPLRYVIHESVLDTDGRPRPLIGVFG